MPLLIDTYNVLHVQGVMPPELAGNDIPWLIHLIQHSRHRTDRTTLVCDGSPPATSSASSPTSTSTKLSTPLVERFENLTVRYAGKGRSADDLIAELIRASTAPRRLLVISSDQAVVRTARRRRCKTASSEEFLRSLAEDQQGGALTSPRSKPPSGMTDAQVDRWVNVFGLDDRTLAIKPGETSLPPRRTAYESNVLRNPNDASRAGSEDPANPQAIEPSKTGPMLPKDLIEQAERLWDKSAQRRPSPPVDPKADTPDDDADDENDARTPA